MIKFVESTSIKIDLLEEDLKNISNIDKINRLINEDNTRSFDIYFNDVLIGFVLLKEYNDGYFLWDYAIDYKYQNKGYGTKILQELIEMLKNNPNASWISTTYKFGNNRAKHLYEKLGFVETSVVDENAIHEVNMKRYLK